MFTQRKKNMLKKSLWAFYYFLLSFFALGAMFVFIDMSILIPHLPWYNGCGVFLAFFLFGISLVMSIRSLRTIKRENKEYRRQMQLLGSVLVARATMLLQDSQQQQQGIDENRWDDHL